MAFTKSEFLRGALTAWLWFLLIALVVYALWLNIYVVVAAAFFIPWSAAGLAAGAPLAYGLGRALQRQPRVGVHFAAFAVLGAVVGALTTMLAEGFMDDLFQAPLIYTCNVLASATAVSLGWWSTARKALRADSVARANAVATL